MSVLWYIAATGEILGLLLAPIALSLWLADRLEQRTRHEQDLTPEQRATLRILREWKDGQPR